MHYGTKEISMFFTAIHSWGNPKGGFWHAVDLK